MHHKLLRHVFFPANGFVIEEPKLEEPAPPAREQQQQQESEIREDVEQYEKSDSPGVESQNSELPYRGFHFFFLMMSHRKSEIESEAAVL
ncbi:unnamed protein product [Caenorhabditis bovis]|uniref:Uncharacterized protein n=1 Tax=Caenorhabditis bovis TaxID=2654633 RepID=A0A8S1EN06_9PELO|nr:unnamed protein product [Caenorhabditis bovis]